jgi:hypothetical protein
MVWLSISSFTIHHARAPRGEIPGVGFGAPLYIGWFTVLLIFTVILTLHHRAHLFVDLHCEFAGFALAQLFV